MWQHKLVTSTDVTMLEKFLSSVNKVSKMYKSERNKVIFHMDKQFGDPVQDLGTMLGLKQR